MVSIDVWNASVDFPIFDAKTRSFKKIVLGKVGGKISTEAKVPVIEALHNITVSFKHGDRVGLVGHNGAGKSMLLRTYSTGMRVRLALGVVTSIDPEILLLDEGIGAVDAAFMSRARERLNDLVKRSGLLVFASHSDEFLVDLCNTGIWMDEGQI